jgi:two-component system chemotaxis response regulator CheB
MTMPGRNLVVVGGSAGSLGPLITLLQGLPAECDACILVVVHSSPESTGRLAEILGRASQLPVSVAVDGEEIDRGVFVAPPNHHLIVSDGKMRVTLGPKENGFRPAIDPLFRTAASAYGDRVIGVVLSGALDDGAHGLGEIKSKEGLTIVQDPDEAEVATMPRSAMQHVDVDYVLPAVAIAPLLCRALQSAPEGDVDMARGNHTDPQQPGDKTDISDMKAEFGPPSALTCPDCGGALWQIDDGRLVRFQCHVGHRYSPESFVMRHDERVERALWSAVRALEERADLRRRMAHQTEAAGLAAVSEQFAEQADGAQEQANQIREVLGRTEAAPEALEEMTIKTRRKRTRHR